MFCAVRQNYVLISVSEEVWDFFFCSLELVTGGTYDVKTRLRVRIWSNFPTITPLYVCLSFFLRMQDCRRGSHSRCHQSQKGTSTLPAFLLSWFHFKYAHWWCVSGCVRAISHKLSCQIHTIFHHIALMGLIWLVKRYRGISCNKARKGGMTRSKIGAIKKINYIIYIFKKCLLLNGILLQDVLRCFLPHIPQKFSSS